MRDILRYASKEVRHKLRKDLNFVTCILRGFPLQFIATFEYVSDSVRREVRQDIVLLKESISSSLTRAKDVLNIAHQETRIALGQDKKLLTEMCKALLKESDLQEILEITGNFPMKDKEWIMEFVKKCPQFTRAFRACVDPDILKDPDIQPLFSLCS